MKTIWSLLLLVAILGSCFALLLACDSDDDDDDSDDDEDADVDDDDDDDDDDDSGDDDDDDDDTGDDDDDDDDDSRADDWALSFDGEDDYAETSAAIAPDFGPAWTVEGWFYFNDAESNAEYLLSNIDLSKLSHGGLMMLKGGYPAKIMLSYMYGEGVGSLVHSTSEIPSGQWLHVAGTYDDGDICIYINGVQEHCRDLEHTMLPTTAKMVLGASEGYNVGLDGMMDNVRISSIVRYTDDFTPEQTFGVDADTVALWGFGEGSGTASADEANANDLTLYNGVGWFKR